MRFDTLPIRVGRVPTRFIGFALALAVVALISGLAAETAGALAFDDRSPCAAAYTEPVGEEPGPQPDFVCPGGLVGTPYAVQLVAHGGCEPDVKFTVNGALPPGLSISTGGLISGTPAIAGRWRFRVRAEDFSAAEGGPDWCTSSEQADGDFVIAVDPGIAVTTEVAAPATMGAFYSLPLSAQLVSGPHQLSPPSGCAADAAIPTYCPLTWSIVQGGLPARLTLNPISGLIWGTPNAEGSASFVVRAELDDGRSTTKGFTITVRRPLSIHAPRQFAPARLEVGAPVTAKLVAAGGTNTYSWSFTGGALPRGLSLAADGTLAGAPRAAGRFRVTIHVTDDEGRAADYPALFRVASRLAIGKQTLRPLRVGLAYRARLATTGGLGPTAWRIESGALPPGMRFDRVHAELRGTPTRSGRYRVTFQATDAVGVRATRTLVIHVLG